jgi:Methyltransferase FkbM domain
MHKLDDYAERDPTLLKIDVEGFEHSVLLGGADVLKSPSLQAIIIETVTDESAVLLANAGFSRVYYDPFKRTLSDAPPYRQMSNELFVRNQSLVAKRLREAPAIDVWGLKV